MVALSHSGLLRLKIQLASPPLDAAFHAFWGYPDLEAIFPEYLLRLYSSVRATVPLMEAAEARSRELAATDPVATQLVPYLVEHIGEEMHHDEWLLEDMESLGMNPSVVTRSIPPSEIASLVGGLHYWIAHVHPVALLGGFAVLEGYPMPITTLDRLLERTNLPKAALRTFYKHAELDPTHRDDLDNLLDALPLSAEQSKLLSVAAFHVIEHLTKVIQELVKLPQKNINEIRPGRAHR